MHIYFGKTPDEVIDATGLNGLFVSQDSETFYSYGIDFGTMGTDEIVIYDGLDRRIPIDTDSIESLIDALVSVQEYLQRIKEVEQFTNNISSANFSISV